MRILKDHDGCDVRLTDERFAHILEHPEMQNQDARIVETLLSPDSIIASHHDPPVHLSHRLYERTPVTRKYLVVMVKYLESDAFIVTAFFTDQEKKGTRLWPPQQ